MKAAYLLIDAAALAFPLAFSFSSRFGFGRKGDWGKAWCAVLLSALPFAAWDVFFTHAGIWSFNPDYVLGPSLLGLPLEEILFFLAIPFSCLFIYQQFRSRHPDPPDGETRGRAAARSRQTGFSVFWAAIAMGLLTLAMLHSDKAYTAAVAFLGSFTAALLAVLRPRYSRPLAFAIAVQYAPFLLVNGLLTGLPVVLYGAGGILGLRIGSIPVEDAIYSFVMLVGPVAIFEALKAAKPRLPAMPARPDSTRYIPGRTTPSRPERKGSGFENAAGERFAQPGPGTPS